MLYTTNPVVTTQDPDLGGTPPPGVRKTRFLLTNQRVSSVRKKVRNVKKRFVEVFLFSDEFRKLNY